MEPTTNCIDLAVQLTVNRIDLSRQSAKHGIDVDGQDLTGLRGSQHTPTVGLPEASCLSITQEDSSNQNVTNPRQSPLNGRHACPTS